MPVNCVDNFSSHKRAVQLSTRAIRLLIVYQHD